MGDPGSGRYWGCGKATVEDGLTLDINKLVRDGNIRPGQWRSGMLTWRRVARGEEVGSIGYEANLIDPDDAWMRLHCRLNGEPKDFRIPLETTGPNCGGKRRCPATGHRTGGRISILARRGATVRHCDLRGSEMIKSGKQEVATVGHNSYGTTRFMRY